MILDQLLGSRGTRRVFNTKAAAAAAALLATTVPGAWAERALAEAPAAGPVSPARTAGGLLLLPSAEAPFDTTGRRNLALDALNFFVRLQGLFPGRGVYQLPAAPWFGGYEAAASKRAWDMTVPAGVPLYLLANADDDGQFDPSLTTVTVNGTGLGDLSAYAHAGVPAPSFGRIRDFAVLDLVFAPPASGQYHLEVRTRLPAPVQGVNETLLVYDVSVQAPDSLSPLLLRDPGGNLYATVAGQRRQIPDLDTMRALGYGDRSIASASAGLIAALPEGAPVPPLANGTLVRAESGGFIFRLQDGQRLCIANPDTLGDSPGVTTVDAVTLQTIPPLLADDMLLKGAAADVYHVNRLSLRKIPDWKWANERGLFQENVIYVPDRIIDRLPQNSPEWVMPAGTWKDRAFQSDILGRSMPYRVYLPPGYDAPEQAGQRYPVIYLLHGFGGRYDEWSGYGAEEVANQLYVDGKFGNIIMVAPQGGLGYWMNQDAGTRWADYVANEVVNHVDATYRTIAKREARAIGGLSMGAHGAMQIALNFPQLFGIVGAHSPSIRGRDSAPAYFGADEAGFAQRDPISLVRTTRLGTPPQIWIDAGQQDFWRPSAVALHQALLDKGWTHEWHVYPGDHDGWYWGDHLWEYLTFYSTALQKNGVLTGR